MLSVKHAAAAAAAVALFVSLPGQAVAGDALEQAHAKTREFTPLLRVSPVCRLDPEPPSPATASLIHTGCDESV